MTSQQQIPCSFSQFAQVLGYEKIWLCYFGGTKFFSFSDMDLLLQGNGPNKTERSFCFIEPEEDIFMVHPECSLENDFYPLFLFDKELGNSILYCTEVTPSSMDDVFLMHGHFMPVEKFLGKHDHQPRLRSILDQHPKFSYSLGQLYNNKSIVAVVGFTPDGSPIVASRKDA